MKHPSTCPRSTSLALWGLLSLLPFVGCGGEGAEPAGVDGPPPIVLVSIDTLRWDRLPAYGYDGVETPALDELLEDSVLFETAYSHMPLTLPAHASMLTGLLPPEHGVRVNMGYRLDGAALPSVPDLLRNNGYATGASVSSYVLRAETGIEHGFDFFDDQVEFRAGVGLEGLQRDGGATLEAALPWLRSVAERPFFFFLHLYEPHTPHKPPEPFASRYGATYDGEIAAADQVVGQLVETLRELDLYDRSLLVITSDHGEGLGDHGEEGHGILLYRSTMQIPLLVKLPKAREAGRRVAPPAQLIDLAPTLLQMADVPIPPQLTGTSLLDLLEEGPDAPWRRIYGETFYPRLYFGWSELRTLFDGRHQYIASPKPELYDLENDPTGATNLIATERRLAAAMRQELDAIPPNFDPGAAESVDVETRRRLESLGYAGGARSQFTGQLPAPGEQVHLIALLQEGYTALASQRYAQAAAAFRGVLDENEHVIVAWELLARCQERMGRLREAAESYGQAVERSGGEPHLLLAAGEVLLTLGEVQAAGEHGELAVAWDPASGRDLMARAALAGGQLDLAEELAQLGLREQPDDPRLHLALARVERLRGNLEAALEHARTAESNLATRSPKGLFLVLGDVLARLGRVDEGLAALRQEIDAYPRDPQAYSNLALLLSTLGRRDEAAGVVNELLESVPNPRGWAVAIDTLRAAGQTAEATELYRQARARFPESPIFRPR